MPRESPNLMAVGYGSLVLGVLLSRGGSLAWVLSLVCLQLLDLSKAKDKMCGRTSCLFDVYEEWPYMSWILGACREEGPAG
jgi:hypothetical protein